MNSRSIALKETSVILLGQLVCVAAMVGVFAALGRFQMSVLWGGLAGAAVAVANFFFMSLFAGIAADKAAQQDVAGGQKIIQLSYMGRMAGMLIALVLCAKSGLFHTLALVLPLAFNRPILTVAELIKTKGGVKQ